MRKLVSQLVFCTVFAIAMFAQSSTGSSGQGSGSNASSSSDSSQTYQGSQGSSAGGQNSIEGCIFERRTAYYIQPVNGGQPTQLSAGNQDLASHVGQDVRVSGNMSSGSNTSASNSSTSGSSGSVAGSADQGQVLLVQRVDEVAKRCPADTQQQIDQGNSSAASPR